MAFCGLAVGYRGSIMKLFACLSFALVVAVAPSFAAVEQCRHIKARADREACYGRQSKSLAEKPKPGAAVKTTIDPVDQLKDENDRVNRRLQGICRGC
jgi:hypothetical protein